MTVACRYAAIRILDLPPDSPGPEPHNRPPELIHFATAKLSPLLMHADVVCRDADILAARAQRLVEPRKTGDFQCTECSGGMVSRVAKWDDFLSKKEDRFACVKISAGRLLSIARRTA